MSGQVKTQAQEQKQQHYGDGQIGKKKDFLLLAKIVFQLQVLTSLLYIL